MRDQEGAVITLGLGEKAWAPAGGAPETTPHWAWVVRGAPGRTWGLKVRVSKDGIPGRSASVSKGLEAGRLVESSVGKKLRG